MTALQLIELNGLEVYLQPIISMRQEKIIAFEALTRVTPEYAGFLTLSELFLKAKRAREIVSLDQYVQKLALEKFASYYKEDNSLLIFMNFEMDTIFSDNSLGFIEYAKTLGIPLENIVVEIKEDECLNNQILKDFIDNISSLGVNVGIDDFGAECSSLHRLSVIRPSIIKIDIALISGIENNFVNQEIVSSIVSMARHTQIENAEKNNSFAENN